ncbi:zinc finger protein ZFP2 [Helicoverpa armigera]|uniref:zinc finger protein ZFP2 n=1 Tax=Helicoverpa armigera TaxID=29058 RepID=UPI003082C358
MTEIFNLSTLCRCCHADGHFKSLQVPYEEEHDVEIYNIMLRETLGISISTPPLEASYTICDNCILRLRDATNFKHQVLICEQKFSVYCQNEQFIATQNVKIEENDDAHNEYDDLETDLDEKQSIDVDVKKEYSIEVDIGHPVEELKDEKPVEVSFEETEYSDADEKAPIETGTTISKKEKKKEEEEEGSLPTKNDSSSLIIQIKTENGDQYSCKSCGGSYPNKKEINKHMHLKHTVYYKCEHCHQQLKTYKVYKKHLVLHSSEKLQCLHCNRKFSNETTLSDHIINKHTKTNIYTCDFCNAQFKARNSVLKHLKIHYGTNKKILCDLCGNSFNDQSNLYSHIRAVHEKLRPYKCSECGKDYTTKRHLRDHLKTHDSERTDINFHTCDICGYKLVKARQMLIHRMKHDGKYMCKICDAVFDSFLTRQEHLNTFHHKFYPCNICGKVLVCKYSLNRHVNEHKGKNFACDICGMKFSQKCGLKRHVFRKHNPDAGFEENKTQCDICKKRFKNIAVHIDKHHNNRFSCDQCGNTYADNSALNRHKAQKHFGRTFDCEVCGKRYVQRSKLNTHRLKVHKIKNEDNNSEGTENQTLSVT